MRNMDDPMLQLRNYPAQNFTDWALRHKIETRKLHPEAVDIKCSGDNARLDSVTNSEKLPCKVIFPPHPIFATRKQRGHWFGGRVIYRRDHWLSRQAGTHGVRSGGRSHDRTSSLAAKLENSHQVPNSAR